MSNSALAALRRRDVEFVGPGRPVAAVATAMHGLPEGRVSRGSPTWSRKIHDAEAGRFRFQAVGPECEWSGTVDARIPRRQPSMPSPRSARPVTA